MYLGKRIKMEEIMAIKKPPVCTDGSYILNKEFSAPTFQKFACNKQFE